ncbi:uncharacterized protein LAESUDRAFT_733068 [Laetiporus sulphureus 93-53]|uniref:Uncharacterized protein n=1 Tax=Laetiporus sulphureus 93-53 TaxID=1314785 RepID=A0A165AS98_9APHY|nr:uncharacterized protein LAESUDRAFT_733068 [Laetiporus sulphureus 93-53]KZS99563.1 hypothetical protein LAESUDRAFT_733068 [Laetiporus sulphureus 93-53]
MQWKGYSTQGQVRRVLDFGKAAQCWRWSFHGIAYTRVWRGHGARTKWSASIYACASLVATSAFLMKQHGARNINRMQSGSDDNVMSIPCLGQHCQQCPRLADLKRPRKDHRAINADKYVLSGDINKLLFLSRR